MGHYVTFFSYVPLYGFWLAFLLCTPLTSQGLKTLQVENFRERIDSDAAKPVSGGIWVGYVALTGAKPSPRIFIRIGSELFEKIEVTIVSRDGGYRASFKCNVPHGQGLFHVPVPTQHPEVWKNRDETFFGVLVVGRVTRPRDELIYIPAAWKADSTPSPKLVGLVNRGAATSAYITPYRKEAPEVPCNEISADDVLAFNASCDLSKVVFANGRSDLQLRRPHADDSRPLRLILSAP